MRIAALIILAAGMPFLLGAGSDSSSSSSSSSKAKHEQYFEKGLKAQKNNDFEDAIEWYNKAIKAKPDYADALNNLGFSYRKIAWGYMQQADDAYRKALKADPKHEDALEYQGELFLWQGELAKADANYKKLKAMNSDEASELKSKLDKVVEAAKAL